MKLPKDLSRKEVVDQIHNFLKSDEGLLFARSRIQLAVNLFDDVFGTDCDRVIATTPDSHVLWQVTNEQK